MGSLGQVERRETGCGLQDLGNTVAFSLPYRSQQRPGEARSPEIPTGTVKKFPKKISFSLAEGSGKAPLARQATLRRGLLPPPRHCREPRASTSISEGQAGSLGPQPHPAAVKLPCSTPDANGDLMSHPRRQPPSTGPPPQLTGPCFPCSGGRGVLLKQKSQ